MRIWLIPYSYLDQQRLLSQHNEIHGLSTVILKGGKWGSISDQFKESVHFMREIHERCVREMAIRAERQGKASSHTSPFIEIDKIPPHHKTKDYKPTREELETDVKQLRAKWEREGYFFGIGRVDLRRAEKQLGLPEGRDPEDCYRQKARTRLIVKEHKDRLAKMGDLRLGDKLDILAKELGKDPRSEG
jgi:hypothetical protein